MTKIQLLALGVLTLLAACGDGDSRAPAPEDGTTTGNADGSTGGSPPVGSTSGTTGSEPEDEPTTSTGEPDASSTTDGPGPETSGGPTPECEPECADGEKCVGGICIDDPDAPVDEDPVFPSPVGGCPDGYLDLTMALDEGSINVCSPLCDVTAPDIFEACPQPRTGTATAACVLNDFANSSYDPCENNGGACEGQEGEYCLLNPEGENVCFQGVSCLLPCSGGQVCPDFMTCIAGSCAYE